MADESRVEVIIRKKPDLDLHPSGTPGVPTVPSSGSSKRDFGKFFKILIIIAVIGVVGFGAYKLFPTATSFVLAGFGEKFDYTVTAKAVETFYDEGIKEVSIIEETDAKTQKVESDTVVKIFTYDGDDLKEETSFAASKDDSVRVEFDYFSGEGGSARIFVDGERVFSDLRLGLEGVQIQYEAIIEQKVERTAVQEGTARVARNGNERKIAEITVIPEAQKDGELSETTYEVTCTDENEEAHIDGYVGDDEFLYVKFVSDVAEEA
ncbi:MAG: hypothetical protein KJ767_03775 [Nanoarchaeota archaeon]|nr:hypothetical protein [Nanoarchaeota archaeon]